VYVCLDPGASGHTLDDSPDNAVVPTPMGRRSSDGGDCCSRHSLVQRPNRRSQPATLTCRFDSNRLRQNPAIDTNEIERELARLEKELQRVVHLARKSDAALAALEEQRDEYAGRLQLARRAEEDVKRRIDEKRVELQRAEDEAVIENYERAVGERESAAERFASAASAAVAALREYEAAQESVAHALKAVRSRPGAGRSVKSEAEPAIVAQSVELLVDAVRKRLDTDFERDLVEAAARSPMGHDIKNLPAHLQALARERRLAILNEATRRDHRGVEGEPRS